MARRWIVGAAAALVVAVGLASWPFTVDDAFIVARYAANLAEGRGWAMNPGVPTDGVTGPLWVLPMWIGEVSGMGPLLPAKLLGLAGAAGAAALVVSRVRRRAGGRRAARVTAALLVVQPTLGVWAVAGLSTGVATLLTTGAALAALERPRPRPWLAGGCVAVLAWLRPELAFAAAVLLGALFVRDRRAGWVALGVAAVGAAAVLGFRFACFGDPLPLSFHAKPAAPAAGALYVLRALLVVAGVGGVPLVVRAVRVGRFDDRVLGAVLAAHLLAVALVGGDWMPGFRLVAPVLPLYAILAGVGATRPSRGRPAPRWVPLLGVLALVIPLADLAVQLPRVRDAGEARTGAGARLADWLRENARTVALVDAGYLPWASGVEVVDLGGVTEPRVARARGGHVDKEIDPGWLEARSPDVIVLHSAELPQTDAQGNLMALAGFPVERRVARMPWVRAHYRVDRVEPYADRYYYALLVRRSDGAERRRSAPTPSRSGWP